MKLFYGAPSPPPSFRPFEPHKIQMAWWVDLADPISRAAHEKDLRDMLDTLTNHNRRYLVTHPETPLLYHSGVRYEEEPIGQEDWCDVRTILQQGWGDCEDLACWRAAELQNAGVNARAIFLARQLNPKTTLFHIVTELPPRLPFIGQPMRLPGAITHFPNGRVIEDPSRRCGMGDKPSQYAALAA